MFVPPASDRWRPTPTLLAALAAICLWAAVCGAALDALGGPRLLGYALVPAARPQQWRVTSVWPGSYAWDAGLRPGLLLRAAPPATRGTATLYLVQGRLGRPIRMPPPGEPDWRLVRLEVALSGIVLALGVGTLLHARERLPARLFLTFCLVMALGLCGVAASAQGAIWGSVLFESCWFVLLGPLILPLAAHLPSGGRRVPAPWAAALLLAGLLLLLQLAGYRHPAVYLPSRALMGALFAFCQIAAACLWIWRALPARGGPDWPAYRLVLAGLSGAFGGFALTAVLPAMLGWTLPWPVEASGIVLLLFPLGLALALLRHRLLDLRGHLQRAAVSAALLCCALGAALAVALAGQGVPGAALGVLLAGLGVPLAQRAVDRRLPDGRAAYAALVQRSGERLALAVTRADLAAVLEDARQGLGVAGLRMRQDASVVAEAGAAPWRLACSLPVAHEADALAVLEVGEKLRHDRLLTADREALAILSGQLGAFLARRRLTGELERTVERLERSRQGLLTARRVERERLGQDLHRGPLQGMMLLRQSLPADSSEAALAAQVGAALRGILSGTTSTTLRELGLAAALRALVEYLQPRAREHGCAIHAEIDPAPGPLGEDASFALYALAHEALLNAMRHSGACRIDLRLSREGDRVQALVRDDGRGLPAGWDAPRAGHRGLRDALDLARAASGARATVESRPGAGVAVQASAPVLVQRQGTREERRTMEQVGTTRLLIAEDHAVMREGLRRALAGDRRIQIVAEARTGHEILSLTLKHRPAILLLDIDLPGQSGLEALAEVREHIPDGPRAVVLSAFGQEEHVRRARELGAHGFLLKDGDGAHVLRAVQRVAAGERVFDGPIAETLGQQHYSGGGRLRHYADGSQALSAAEREVLRLMAGDRTYEEIAASLGRAAGTVRNQAAAVQEKLEVGSRQQAVLKALQLGILQLKDLELGR